MEITHGGMWFRWGSLDRTSKWLLVASSVAAVAGLTLLLLIVGPDLYGTAYKAGYAAGSGGQAPRSVPTPLIRPTPLLGWATVGLLLMSGLLWWRLSLRQDEMFNRIQNWSLGMSGAWATLVLTFWAVLATAGVLPTVSAWGIVFVACALFSAFWLIAVRRWA